jgi:VWFA-related protein
LRKAIERIEFVPPAGYIGRGVVVNQPTTRDSYHGGVDRGSLKKVAEKTGGRAYFPESERELRAAFEQIQRDLREQYLVAYSPSNKNRDGSYRRIQIEIIDPELRKANLKLNYRPGYFAKTATGK